MKFKQLTLREKLSQVLMIEVEGSVLSHNKEALLQMLKKMNFGIVMISKPLESIEKKMMSLLKHSHKWERLILSELSTQEREQEQSFFDGVLKKDKLKGVGIDGVVLSEEVESSEFIQGLKDEAFFLVSSYTQSESAFQKDYSGSEILALPKMKNYECRTASYKQHLNCNSSMEISKKMIEKKIREHGRFKGVVIETHIEKIMDAEKSLTEKIIHALSAGVDCVKIPITVKGNSEIEKISEVFNELYLCCLKDPQLEHAVSRGCNRILMLKQGQGEKKQELLQEVYRMVYTQNKIDYYN